MDMPVKNRVSEVDLRGSDAFLPLFECVVNAIISLKKEEAMKEEEKKIQIQLIRGNPPSTLSFDGSNVVDTIKVIDNGGGFTEKNMLSYKTAYSHENKDYGCKGIGRFTVLAAFREIQVTSTYQENGLWRERQFVFNQEDEVKELSDAPSDVAEARTIVTLSRCYNPSILDYTAVSVNEVAAMLMNHCLVYYLCKELPRVELIDMPEQKGAVVNDLYAALSKERERSFEVQGEQFNCYVMKTEKRTNRKNHYIYYCANSRVVGDGRSLGGVNPAFSYPIMDGGREFYLDVYVVSQYLNQKVYNSRNGFSIPQSVTPMFSNGAITFDLIEEKLAEALSEAYKKHVDETKKRTVESVKTYIREHAPRYRRYLNRDDVFDGIPANLNEDKIEEYLGRVAHMERKRIDRKIQEAIDNKEINQDAIEAIRNELVEKAAVDADTLADYMLRRRAIIELFKKFLEADAAGRYKLEEDIHNLIFPKGVTSKDIDYESHNLWLLDERFAQYHFVASDIPISRFSQVKSRKEPDLVVIPEPEESIFGKPISFAQERAGEVSSMVIFEFKRPGEVAHQKKSTDFRWEFSELVEPYFDDFMFSAVKKNWTGNQVLIKAETPKHGFVIVDVIPPQLEAYNRTKGWKKTPFGSFYKINGDNNMHIEVITFQQLISAVEKRHAPFFDKLFRN